MTTPQNPLGTELHKALFSKPESDVPALTNRFRVDLYRWMCLTRTLDDTMVTMWKQGRGLGGTFSGRGHEAISVAMAMALEPDDVIAPMHRDVGSYLVRGMTPARVFGNLLGRETGPSGGRDANLHGMGDLSLGIVGYVSHIPQQLPLSLGVAMSFKYRGEPRVALTVCGDGGTTTGPYHESLNMAALYQAPLVLIVENNKYAYSTPLHQQMATFAIAERAAGYGLNAVSEDGNDVEAMYLCVKAAVERAREGGGASVIEARTMRMLGHAIHDGAEYVPKELLEKWEARDPLVLYRRRLLQEGRAKPAQLEEIEAWAQAEIEQAVAEAEAAPFPDPGTVTDRVYA
ncbi:MAG: thiamine pyrophosphate-dependent dehydrogenase E1 component subunit alpha [bacterium]|nr:thiamine pyrophosphate-dependent dehydrogenase E1 component subunit alpha [Acidimicrobiia bacterium]MCY4649592.1 thiamine pyrophosphate-dependent dehydrogenase E1 component subunit alpha [bacterium]